MPSASPYKAEWERLETRPHPDFSITQRTAPIDEAFPLWSFDSPRTLGQSITRTRRATLTTGVHGHPPLNRRDHSAAAQLLALAMANTSSHTSLPASEFTTTFAGFLDAHSDATPNERCCSVTTATGQLPRQRSATWRIGKANKPKDENQPAAMQMSRVPRNWSSPTLSCLPGRSGMVPSSKSTHRAPSSSLPQTNPPERLAQVPRSEGLAQRLLTAVFQSNS